MSATPAGRPGIDLGARAETHYTLLRDGEPQLQHVNRNFITVIAA